MSGCAQCATVSYIKESIGTGPYLVERCSDLQKFINSSLENAGLSVQILCHVAKKPKRPPKIYNIFRKSLAKSIKNSFKYKNYIYIGDQLKKNKI